MVLHGIEESTYTDTNNSLTDGKTKDKFWSTILGAGMGYFITKNIAIEAIVDSTEDLREDSGNGPYYYTSQLNFNIGIVAYFGKYL